MIFDTDNGLPSSTVYDLLQDKQGFIWIGTNRGLVRWDGERFTTFTMAHGLPDLEVMRLAEDHLGRIWIMTFSQGMCFYQNGKIHNHLNDALVKKAWKPGYISAFHQTRDHRLLFFHTQKGIIEIDGQEINYYDVEGEASGYLTKFVIEDESHNLWKLWGHDKIKQISGPGVGTFRNCPIAIHDVSNAAFFQGPNSELFVPIDKGILRISDQEWKIVVHYADGGSPMIRVWLLPNNDLAMSIQHRGLLLFKSVGEDEWDPEPEIIATNGTFSSVCMDAKGNLILGSITSGIHIIFRTQIRTFVSEPVFPAPAALSGVKNPDGSIWVLSSKKMLLYYHKGTISLPPAELRFGMINAGLVKNLGQGILAVGGERLLLFKLNPADDAVSLLNKLSFSEKEPPGIKQPIIKSKPPLSYVEHFGTVKDISLDEETGIIYVATSSGFFELSGMESEKTGKLKTLFRGRTHSLALGEKGSRFFSTQEGIFVMGGKDTVPHSLAGVSPLLSIPSNCMASHPSAGLILVNARGLVQWNNNDTRLLEPPGGRSDEQFNSVLFDSTGQLWVTGNRGIHLLRFEAGRARWEQHWTSADGLASNEVTSLFFSGDTIFACTPKGLSVFRAEQTRQSKSLPPPIIITDIFLEGRDTLLPDTFTLPPLYNNIRFLFAGLSFEYLGQMRYQYRLLGLDTNWVETTEPEVTFSFLQPGDYTLEVIAFNKDGIASEVPARRHFTILTPWYRTTLFRLGLTFTLLLISAFIFFVRYRIRQRQAELQRRITEAEHKALRAQMNPHFIFNAMNSIQRFLATNDRKEAITYFSRFGRLIRLILDASRNQAISLADEVQTLTLYAQLEQLRTDHKFEFAIETDPDLDPLDIHLPPMLVQPYLENAIWHGVMHKEGPGHIGISISRVGESLQFVIEDDGIGREAAAKMKTDHRPQHKSHGTRITEERLQLLNESIPGTASVQFKDLTDGEGKPAGTRVTVLLPLMD